MDEKTVLITGTSSGIGRATAERFLAEGWIVYATARNPADVETLGEHDNARIATLDVTDASDVERVADRVVDEAGRLDCLVNNAGYAQHGPIEDIPVADVHRQFDVNVYGPHRLIRTFLPLLREQEEGTIVNVSSVAGRIAVPGTGVYSGSKAALEAMSDALRGEVADVGVDVVVVEPGPVETGFQDRFQEELPDEDRTMHAYGWLYDLIDDWSTVGAASPLIASPGAVADVIRDAACVTDPEPRYAVGPGARLMLSARYLPDPLRDRVIGLVRRATS